MIIEAGHYALVLALVLSIVQGVLPFWGARAHDRTLIETSGPIALGVLFFIAASFAALTWAYVASDFSVLNVVQNSHSAKPLIYKISGVWGNHEGSMLLWVLILALFAALVVIFGRRLPPVLRADVLAVQGWIAAAFLVFIIAASNPFARVSPPPIEGQDLNPLLQDIGLALHPPLLYLGYVGFSMSFAFAVAALIEGRIDAAWARWVRPWTLAAWISLTLGIALGSYWAYYELGWGGFWFWDPVENASLLPWLAGTALLHSALVVEKRDALKIWTVLLAILTFSLSLLGTFLVRSGVLTSVHAFAVDPQRGLFILIILAVFIGGSLSLFAARAGALKPGGLFSPISREGGLVLNNLLLSAVTVTVLVGTLYPLALEAVTGHKISVGPPFFNATVGPLFLPLLIALPFGPLLAWKRGDIGAAAQRLLALMIAAALLAMVLIALVDGASIPAMLALALGAYVAVGGFSELVERSRLGRVSPAESLRRLVGLPRSAWGGALGHAGVGLTLIGIVAATAGLEEHGATLTQGQSIEAGGYTVTLERIEQRNGSNYRDLAGVFSIRRGGVEKGEVEAAKRIYIARGMETTEVGLVTFGLGQLYVVTGERSGGTTLDVRLSWRPLVLLIWGGAFIMAAGGLLSLADRRLRLGAPRRAAARSVPVAAE
ncbi:c-type cytochrome biogenesis protein CcmF [Agaricicola taiwanensis]|uniref:C-type cytochrome biogenesis protein CcmF n=1 Tax=Agaricicola taiwanensis TaxID=591372 RepID=A0A8J2YGN9_9RHOB|nr:heme lyase CcmF/NrfE family subunit [Agaricicola taiwanensis]GGE37111.1 c-type cytochrome biogenesis protein CcmF [Agaricicola taiwanensis]